MERPSIIDNDQDEISVTLDGKEIRGWSYGNDDERSSKMRGAREYCNGWLEGFAYANAAAQITDVCNELGCTTKPGVALRFTKELRRDLQRAHERHVELLRSWDEATPTERQELDRLRRGWGPSTPTERMARRTDLIEAMHVISRAMDAVVPDDKEDEDLTRDHFQAAYDRLTEGYKAIIALIDALPALTDA